MFKGSSLPEEQREASVALFATGWGSTAVASKLGVASIPIRQQTGDPVLVLAAFR